MPGLFSPFAIRSFTLPNRIVLPPMANDLSDDSGAVTDAHIEHYVRRARADVSMVIVEHAYIRPDGRVGRKQLGIHHDGLVPGLRRLAAAVKASGAVVGVQITHGGARVTQAAAGVRPLGPSDAALPNAADPSVAMTAEQIADLPAAFADAARRALEAGFDFVEVHGAHGYLLNQFLSPLSNRRDDAYGGDLAGRLRLPLEVAWAVRAVVDTDHLLLYRLGAADYRPGGLTAEEGAEAGRALVEAGVDLLDVSGGLCGSQRPGWDGQSQGYFVPLAAEVRARAGAPVVVAGGITDPHAADRFIRDGQTDLVAIGRALLANPDWAAEARRALAGD